jgi:hypothetical protein
MPDNFFIASKMFSILIELSTKEMQMFCNYLCHYRLKFFLFLSRIAKSVAILIFNSGNRQKKSQPIMWIFTGFHQVALLHRQVASGNGPLDPTPFSGR